MNDFERKLRDELRASEQNLSTKTLLNIRSSREAALKKRAGFPMPRVLVPLGGMVLASVALFFLVVSPVHMQTGPSIDHSGPDQAELQELDFYYWLAETQNVTDS